MVRDGTVSGDYYGDRVFHDRISFAQGASGAGLSFIKKDTQIWYVDSGKTSPAVSGDGLTWEGAFMTLAEAVDAAGAHDTILVAPNDIETIATGGIEINQEGLRILGPLADKGLNNAAFKIDAGTSPMFTILADRVEIAGLHLSCRIAYPAICIGSVADGVGTAIYETHIHDCNITGYGSADFGVAMGGAGGFGVKTQCDAVNAVIANNLFTGFTSAAVVVSGSRMVVKNNEFNVPVDTTGVIVVETGSDRGYWSVNDNLFVGIDGTSSYGIEFAGNTTAGQGQVIRNLFAGTWDASIGLNTGYPGVENYEAADTGVGHIDCNGT